MDEVYDALLALKSKAIYLELHPDTAHGANQHTKAGEDNLSTPNFAEATAAITGAELSPADRAKQTARRKAIYLELHPETAHGGDRKSDQVANSATRSFADETAAISGQSARTVRQDAERGEKVIDEVLDMIHGTKLDTGTYLDKLKRLLPNEQVAAAKRDLLLLRTASREQAKTSARTKVEGDVQPA